MNLASPSSHPLYGIWIGIRQRCTNENNHAWASYGGRGIKICDRWFNSFEDFLSDVGERPFDGAQLDRIDNNGNYEPGNTRWVTAVENCKNRRPSSEWGYLRDGKGKSKTFGVRIKSELVEKLCLVSEKDDRSASFIINRSLDIGLELFLKGKLKSNWDYEIEP